MPGQKIKVNMPGIGPVDGTEVAVLESNERWTDIKLDDGATLRIRPVVMAVTRLDGRYDPQGNPMYAVQAQQVMTVSAPDVLRQGAEGSKVH
jgi:hypothetical protein